VRQQYSDEIDLLELFTVVWHGKWQIISFGLVAVLGVVGFNFTQPAPAFHATTEIRPIMSVDAELYRTSNAVGFFEITRPLLLQQYIEQLDQRVLFESAIRKFELLDRAKFKTEELYNEAVIELAASVSLLPPVNADGTEKGVVRRYWTIVAEFNDEEKWKAVLKEVHAEANEQVRTVLLSRFQTSIAVARQKQNFELEDLTTKIKNALADYDRKTADRLAFLREQVAIARKLGVSNSTIEAQMFTAQNSLVANLKTDPPFYLRGYKAIEKEIELIESREVKQSFVEGLLALEQKKRGIEQDKTLERAEMLLATTPLQTKDGFKAVSITVGSTDFEYKSKRMLMIVMAAVLGGMIGAVYVLFSSAVRKRKGEEGSA
jgi:LPS O-antigen subunit length determinant protein (WzzB/FepE family)